jgi:CBS domain-containing protein
VTVRLETMPARDVAGLMHAKGVNRFPLLPNGKLVDIVARSDLGRAPADRSAMTRGLC